jgi:hypothetical protein
VLRFHLDEHVPHSIANGLRRRQIDVTTATDAGLLGASDDEHLAFARQQQRVVFTNDKDFLALAAVELAHAGIAYCPPAKSEVGYVVRYLALMSDCYGPADVVGRVEFL